MICCLIYHFLLVSRKWINHPRFKRKRLSPKSASGSWFIHFNDCPQASDLFSNKPLGTQIYFLIYVFFHLYLLICFLSNMFNTYVLIYFRLDSNYGKYVYDPCYTRMGPYIIGLVTGYLLYKMKCKCRMPKVNNMGGSRGEKATGV